jgi:chromosome condensin MukBEF MukE localization factor
MQVAKVYSKRLFSYGELLTSIKKDKMLNSADQKIIQEQTDEIKRMLEFLLCDTTRLAKRGLLGKNSIYDKIRNLQQSMKCIQVF